MTFVSYIVDYLDETRPLKWANIATSHATSNTVYLWKLESQSISETTLKSSDLSEVTCLQISPCGNFLVFGTSSGLVQIFNIQSGKLRFGKSVPTQQSISSVSYTQNGDTVYMLTFKGLLYSMNTKNGLLSHTLHDFGPIRNSTCLKEIHMLAVSTMDFEVYILDLDVIKTVRRFTGHSNYINDIVLSGDHSRLFTCSFDGTVKVWDLESSLCVYTLNCNFVPFSICISSDSEFLGVSSIENNSISMFVRSFSSSSVNFELQSLSLIEPSELNSLTFSSLSHHQWLHLVNYDIVKVFLPITFRKTANLLFCTMDPKSHHFSSYPMV